MKITLKIDDSDFRKIREKINNIFPTAEEAAENARQKMSSLPSASELSMYTDQLEEMAAAISTPTNMVMCAKQKEKEEHEKRLFNND
ncbi:hypothetical protein GTY77_18140 [Streptomyces sp. SID8380]|nr:hypothetical protein [Streptomyces sp. SID8380]